MATILDSSGLGHFSTTDSSTQARPSPALTWLQLGFLTEHIVVLILELHTKWIPCCLTLRSQLHAIRFMDSSGSRHYLSACFFIRTAWTQSEMPGGEVVWKGKIDSPNCPEFRSWQRPAGGKFWCGRAFCPSLQGWMMSRSLGTWYTPCPNLPPSCILKLGTVSLVDKWSLSVLESNSPSARSAGWPWASQFPEALVF